MIPKLRDYTVKAWDKAKPYLALAAQYLHLKAHQHKFLQGFICGLLVYHVLRG